MSASPLLGNGFGHSRNPNWGATYLASRAWRKDTSDIPGRLGLPFLGETFSFLSATNSTKGCYDFVKLRRQWYGKWFKTRIFGKVHVFVPSIEGAKMIFANDFGKFNKGYVKSMADAVGKKSLLCVPQESHKRIRRLLSDPFSMNSLSIFVKKFDDMLCKRLKRLERDGKSFMVLDFSMKIAFDAMCDMMMSVTDDSLLQQIERDCNDISNAMLSVPVMIPGTRYYKGIKARKRLMGTFEKLITSRRSGKESPEDFLQSMLERDSYPPSEKLDDSEIMDNLLTLIIAGQTTTAAAMMWSVKFLDENREAQDRLREEQLSIIRNKPDGASLTQEDLNNMSYGLKVVKETLRMSNVLLWFPRVALNDCTIQGNEIKKGWHVNIDATCIHYDPDLYKNPMQFNPSRFNELQKPYSFIPFGSGPRTCLGINMAKVTMLAFLHRLASGYKTQARDTLQVNIAMQCFHMLTRNSGIFEGMEWNGSQVQITRLSLWNMVTSSPGIESADNNLKQLAKAKWVDQRNEPTKPTPPYSKQGKCMYHVHK